MTDPIEANPAFDWPDAVVDRCTGTMAIKADLVRSALWLLNRSSVRLPEQTYASIDARLTDP
jgi:hypothetical protein